MLLRNSTPFTPDEEKRRMMRITTIIIVVTDEGRRTRTVEKNKFNEELSRGNTNTLTQSHTETT